MQLQLDKRITNKIMLLQLFLRILDARFAQKRERAHEMGCSCQTRSVEIVRLSERLIPKPIFGTRIFHPLQLPCTEVGRPRHLIDRQGQLVMDTLHILECFRRKAFNLLKEALGLRNRYPGLQIALYWVNCTKLQEREQKAGKET